MPDLQAAVTASMIALLACGCVARTAVHPAGDGFVMQRPPPSRVSVSIIGGGPTDSSIWPATFIFGGGCTATAVGPQVILTAAHCVANGARGQVLTPAPVGVTCTRHNRFVASPSYVIALCITDTPLQNITFEDINSDPSNVASGSGVTILGYGCVQQGGPMVNALYVGSTTVVADPQDPPSVYTLEGGALACQGDSGGAGYSAGSPRFVTGVQSQTNFGLRHSYQVSMTDPQVQAFLRSWSGPPRNAVICGLNASSGTQGCR